MSQLLPRTLDARRRDDQSLPQSVRHPAQTSQTNTPHTFGTASRLEGFDAAQTTAAPAIPVSRSSRPLPNNLAKVPGVLGEPGTDSGITDMARAQLKPPPLRGAP